MMNKENRLVKNVILYTIGNLGSKVLVMLIVPIYTHYMNPAEIGYYDLIVTLAGLICPVIGSHAQYSPLIIRSPYRIIFQIP